MTTAKEPYVLNETATRRVLAILAQHRGWVAVAPLQVQLGRAARAVAACEAIGLIESRQIRIGLRGGLRTLVRLTAAGRTLHAVYRELDREAARA